MAESIPLWKTYDNEFWSDFAEWTNLQRPKADRDVEAENDARELCSGPVYTDLTCTCSFHQSITTVQWIVDKQHVRIASRPEHYYPRYNIRYLLDCLNPTMVRDLDPFIQDGLGRMLITFWSTHRAASTADLNKDVLALLMGFRRDDGMFPTLREAATAAILDHKTWAT